MSAPLIWILLPLIFSAVLLVLHSYRFFVTVSGTVFCLVLALFAWLFPFETFIKIGPFTTEISPVLSFLGRRFILIDGDRFLLVFIYSIGALWFFAESILKRNPIFVPAGLSIIALSLAAVAVEPFLYAALIVELIVLLSIPILVPPGAKFGQGVMRYLIYQTLAMAAILLAGWASAGVEADPTNQALLLQALVFLGLGLAFWLAVFPFYTWIPLLVSEVYPYQAGFIMNFLPLVVLLLTLDFINAFSWLRNFPDLHVILRLIGVIMVSSGGIWAAFQQNLSRLMGYFIIVEMGFSLLALSIGTRIGYEIFVSMFFPRIIVLAVWALSLSVVGTDSYELKAFEGLVRKKPVESIGILIAYFSFSGLPLLANFPLRQALLENLAQLSLSTVIWSLVGIAGLMIASIRVLMVVISSKESKWTWTEDWRAIILLIIGILAILLIGFVPEWIFPAIRNLLNAFTNLT